MGSSRRVQVIVALPPSEPSRLWGGEIFEVDGVGAEEGLLPEQLLDLAEGYREQMPVGRGFQRNKDSVSYYHDQGRIRWIVE